MARFYVKLIAKIVFFAILSHFIFYIAIFTILGPNTFYNISYFGGVEGTYYFNRLNHKEDGSSITVRRGAIDSNGYVFDSECVTLVLTDDGKAVLTFKDEKTINASWVQEGKKVILSYKINHNNYSIRCNRGFKSMTFILTNNYILSDYHIKQTYYLTKY